jgi:hypothetical protein
VRFVSYDRFKQSLADKDVSSSHFCRQPHHRDRSSHASIVASRVKSARREVS